MPVSSYSKYDPLIDSFENTITKPYSILSFPWTVSSEVKSSRGIESRSFSDLEFYSETEWVINPVGIGTENGRVRHYEASVDMICHKFRAAKDQYGDLEDFSNFLGWNYTVEEYKLLHQYEDVLVKTIKWTLYNEASMDTFVETFDSEVQNSIYTGSLMSYTSTSKGVGINVAWSGGDFLVESGTGEYKKEIIQEGLGATPQLLSGTSLKITRPTVQRGATQPESSPYVVAYLEARIYGKYYSQFIKLNEIYDQGWVQHHESTSLEERLKPPGKPNVNDNFQEDTDGVVTGLDMKDV